MYPALASALMFWIASVYADLATQEFAVMHSYQAAGRRVQLQALAQSIQQYYEEKGQFPASLAALVATPGYEHVTSYINNWQGYAVTGTLVDSVWSYQRVIVYSLDPTAGMSQANFLATNTCGAGSFASAISWCPVNSSVWYRWETREEMNDAVNEQRLRLNRTQQKLASYFNARGNFPNLDGSNAPLTQTNTYSLAALANYAGAATNCTGTYSWQGIPIDCGDMFDKWGGRVGYAYFSNTHVGLTSETPLKDGSGNAVNVVGEYDVH